MTNFVSKQPSSRPVKYQVLEYNSATVWTTKFGPNVNQIRVLSQLSGWGTVNDTTADGVIATTAGGVGMIVSGYRPASRGGDCRGWYAGAGIFFRSARARYWSLQARRHRTGAISITEWLRAALAGAFLRRRLSGGRACDCGPLPSFFKQTGFLNELKPNALTRQPPSQKLMVTANLPKAWTRRTADEPRRLTASDGHRSRPIRTNAHGRRRAQHHQCDSNFRMVRVTSRTAIKPRLAEIRRR